MQKERQNGKHESRFFDIWTGQSRIDNRAVNVAEQRETKELFADKKRPFEDDVSVREGMCGNNMYCRVML